MRFVLSLKRAADPVVGQEWKLEHFSSGNFCANSSSGTQASSAARENIEMNPIYPPNSRLKTHGP